MKTKLSFLGAIAISMALALAGVLNGVNPKPAQALMPLPIQPFAPDEVGGMSTTQLGQPITDYDITEIIQGERLAGPKSVFMPPGFQVGVDKDIPDDTILGTVTSEIDAMCDGVVDYLVDPPCTSTPPYGTPLIWHESTTSVEGTSEEYLKSNMPPFSWLLRHRADITNICLWGTDPIPTTNFLDTVYTNVPWSPDQSGIIATTQWAWHLSWGGGGIAPSPTMLCLDSPQNSYSVTNAEAPTATPTPVHGVYTLPALRGDSGGPCPTGANCADGGIVEISSVDKVFPAISTPVAVTIKKKKTNGGRDQGTFYEVWRAIANDPNVEATWPETGTDVDIEKIVMGAGVTAKQTKILNIHCKAKTDSLVTVLNVLQADPDTTKDNNETNDIKKTQFRVICDPDKAASEVDKAVVRVKPVAVGAPAPGVDLGNTPESLNLLQGQAITVSLDELKANHATFNVPGDEMLAAFVPYADPTATPTPGPPLLDVSWVPSSVRMNGTPVPSPTPCDSGDACITYQVDEPHGQSDVTADLTIGCPADTPEGLYSVVVAGTDEPVGFGEASPSDNAAVATISVRCWASEADRNAAQDGIDDATGLYPRWDTFLGEDLLYRGDYRKPYQSPPSIASDTQYKERVIDLQCYWLDEDGCFTDEDATISCDSIAGGGNNNGYIEPGESHLDVEIVQMGGKDTVDKDGDCLIDPAYAQPGRPVDGLDTPLTGSGKDCAAVPWSEYPNVVYNRAADQDCDGLVDGIEEAWGSNPFMADTDEDGATDFVEMFQFTNPGDPDTDGDGLLDKPEDDFLATAVGLVDPKLPTETAEVASQDDNCPTVYNPDQLNSDGQFRNAGSKVPTGIASNPNADKMGNVCDTDDDNDYAPDVAEVDIMDTDPLNADTDGDRCVDGVEGFLGTNPNSNTSKCPTTLPSNALRFFRACWWNLPGTAPWSPGYSGSMTTEMDPDGDGINCPSDPDADNGTGTGSAAPIEILDTIEIEGYNTMPANKDTDGDGCADWVEIMDVNGDRTVNSGDQLLIAKRVCYYVGGPATCIPPSDSDPVLDVNKDLKFNSGDNLLIAKNTCGFMPGVGGCPKCTAGGNS